MTIVSRRTMLSLPLLACRPLAGLAVGAAAPQARPNTLFVMTDDHAAQATVAALKRELWRLKKALGDEDRFANELPQDSSYVQAPPPKKR